MEEYRGLNQTVLDKYMELDCRGQIQACYIWIDGSGETMRSKTKTLDYEPTKPEQLPIWNFDGSSTGQAVGSNSDVYLHPVAIFPDPFRRGKHKLVLCETYTFDHKPTNTNKRKSCKLSMDEAKVKIQGSFLLWIFICVRNSISSRRLGRYFAGPVVSRSWWSILPN